MPSAAKGKQLEGLPAPCPPTFHPLQTHVHTHLNAFNQLTNYDSSRIVKSRKKNRRKNKKVVKDLYLIDKISFQKTKKISSR